MLPFGRMTKITVSPAAKCDMPPVVGDTVLMLILPPASGSQMSVTG